MQQRISEIANYKLSLLGEPPDTIEKASERMSKVIEVKFSEGTDGHSATICVDKVDAIVRPVLGAPYVLVNGHPIKISEADAERLIAALQS